LSESAQRERELFEYVERALPALTEHGRRVGPYMPWHHSEDPYHWFIAESLLRLTTRKAASRAFSRLIESYPTWGTLASADEGDIAERIASAGLAKQRSRQLKALAKEVYEEMGETIPYERPALLSLPGVGPYVADAILLYLHGEAAFPLDGNIQRVFRRVAGLSMPVSRSRRTDPYRDSWLKGAVGFMLDRHPSNGLVDLHRGTLDIGWSTCRYRPSPPLCPIRRVCVYAQTQFNNEV
jgi:A/G-specific adenine glycosylase